MLDIVITDLVKVLYDNISATYIAANSILHGRSKHIKVDYHFVRERVSHGDLVVRYVPSQFQFAYIFTKSLPTTCYLFLKFNLSMHPSP